MKERGFLEQTIAAIVERLFEAEIPVAVKAFYSGILSRKLHIDGQVSRDLGCLGEMPGVCHLN